MNNNKSLRNSFLTVQTLASAKSVNLDDGSTDAKGNFTGTSDTGGYYEFLEFGASQSLAATNNIYNSVSPYTIEFNITKTVSDGQQFADIRLFNVSPARRRALLHPIYTVGLNQYINFQAGYGLGQLPVAYSGFVQHCTETREGVNIVLNFNCVGFPNARPQQIAGTITGTAQQNVETAMQQGVDQYNSALPPGAPKLTIGAIGNFPGLITTQSYNDNWRNVVAGMTNTPASCMAVCDNVVYALNFDEYIVNQDLPIVTSENGLLGSPTTDGYVVTLEMLFEPRLKVFQGLTIQTNFNPFINGFYIVQSVTHQGVISPAVGGTATTKLTLWNVPQPELQAASVQSFNNVG